MSNGISINITEQVYDLQLVTDKTTTIEIFDFSVAGDVIPASIFTNGPGNMLVSAAASDPRQLDNVTVPPADGYVLTWDSTQALKMKFKAAAASGGVITLTNKSGSTVNIGDVVIFDKSNASAFTTTSLQGDMRILGVAMETIAANASGKIAMAGIATVNVTGNVAIGQALISSTTPKYAMASGGAKQPGLIGYALTLYSGGSTGTVSALMMPAFDRAGAAVVVEGVLVLSGSNTTGSLPCGTNSDRLVLAVAFTVGGSAPAISNVPQVASVGMSQTGSDITSFETATPTLARLYYYKAVGTGNITVGNPTMAATYQGCMFIALSGVAASSYLGTLNSSIVTGTAQSVNCTDAIPGDLVIGFNISSDTPTSLSGSGSGQTNRINSTVTGHLSISDTKLASGAAETMSWTLLASRKAISISIPVRPA